MIDPAIKLFGKTIPVTGDSPRESNCSSYSSAQLDFADKELAKEATIDTEDHIHDSSKPVKQESSNPPEEQETDASPKTLDSEDSDHSDEKESSNDPENSQKKHLKKPDKILPCPRCKSMDTKFCYYNNYNVNQPRHFCKSCKRYWTAGGSMRNIPEGSGRRKIKSYASQYSSFIISESLHNQSRGLKSNETMLTFASENALCESMVSSGSTVTTTGSMEDGSHNVNVFPNQMPYFQWPYMWTPPFCPSAFPMPFYPAPPPYWNIHWVPHTLPPAQARPSLDPNSPTLGKHSRDGEMLRTNEGENCCENPAVLVPKTLRIDDPDEAAKSSIWTTLGINKEKGDSTSKGGFFNNIRFTKGKEKDRKTEGSSALKANPAALYRSVTFLECREI